MKKENEKISAVFVVNCSFFVETSNQTAWRKANLACKLAIDNMEKNELLHAGENRSPRQRLVLIIPWNNLTFVSLSYLFPI